MTTPTTKADWNDHIPEGDRGTGRVPHPNKEVDELDEILKAFEAWATRNAFAGELLLNREQAKAKLEALIEARVAKRQYSEASWWFKNRANKDYERTGTFDQRLLRLKALTSTEKKNT